MVAEVNLADGDLNPPRAQRRRFASFLAITIQNLGLDDS
jgi:hypothetical protein